MEIKASLVENAIIQMLDELGERAYSNSTTKGFGDKPREAKKLISIIAGDELDDVPTPIKVEMRRLVDAIAKPNASEKIALMHSELSEMLEAIRDVEPPQSEKIPDFTNEEEEAADLLIRLVDYCKCRQLRIGHATIAKMRYNEGRPYKHGRNF